MIAGVPPALFQCLLGPNNIKQHTMYYAKLALVLTGDARASLLPCTAVDVSPTADLWSLDIKVKASRSTRSGALMTAGVCQSLWLWGSRSCCKYSSGAWIVPRASNLYSQDKASGRTFTVPDTYSTLKLNSDSFSSQCACLQDRSLWSRRWVSPLWSVTQVNLAPCRMSLCCNIISTLTSNSCSYTGWFYCTDDSLAEKEAIILVVFQSFSWATMSLIPFLQALVMTQMSLQFAP